MKKLMNKKGFTLMEMLIVVAIIVILVAISIPTFSSQLDNAKENTDKANKRAAKAVAQTMDMTGEWGTNADGTALDATLYYNIDKGIFEETYTGEAYGQASANSGKVLMVEIVDGAMDEEPDWVDAPTAD